MRSSFRKSKSLPFLILVAMTLPFVVGFDMVDTSGTYAKVSGGRGAYHSVGCYRQFDSEYSEGEIAMRHSFETRENVSQSSSTAYLKPRFTTIGYSADFEGEDVTVVKDDSVPSTVGTTQRSLGFAGGAYVGMDWEWVGLDLGLGGYLFNVHIKDGKKSSGFPMLGLRIGPSDFLYGTLDIFGSNPFLSGGGGSNIGLGGNWEQTRGWIGVGSYPNGGAGGMAMLKLNQGLGAWDFGMTLQGGRKNVPPVGIGIDHEYGFSLAVAYRLSSLDK